MDIQSFEEWILSKYPIAGLGMLDKFADGSYQHKHTQNMFDAYEAGNESWINLKNKKPKENQNVIVFADDAFVLFAQYRNGSFYDMVVDEKGLLFETETRSVVVWMPRPDEPNMEGNK